MRYATCCAASALPPLSDYRGEEARAIAREASDRAHRWVVERTHSWMNRFRRLLLRWEKKPENYVGLLHFVRGIITFRFVGLFG